MNVCVTGGTGSFGQAFIQHYLDRRLGERVVCFSRDEYKQAKLREKYDNHPALRCFLGDVRDRIRCEEAFQRCDALVHAAALKRVDSSYSPGEMVKTNVVGTMNVIDAAIAAGVERVLVLSSDKGVQPQNVYGASKFLAESYAIAANALAWPRGTRVAGVRYGNVLWSRGSLLEVFADCVREGRPFLVTDTRMTRFWLTLDQAVEFVVECLGLMRGGEIFVPVLPSFRVVTLATALRADHPIRYIGRRPGGEKLHEILLTEEESERTLRWEGRYVIRPSFHPWSDAPATWPGEIVQRGWEYRSNTNSPFLGVEDIQTLLKEAPCGPS